MASVQQLSIVFLIVMSACVLFTNSSPVSPCKEGEQKDVDPKKLARNIQIGNCTKLPCKFKRGTAMGVAFKFKTTEEVPEVTNRIFANIGSLPFPWIGVDGTSACDKIYTTDGKNGCPLKANTEYIYKHEIDILQQYPAIRVGVHWALKSGNADILCFEVPARLT